MEICGIYLRIAEAFFSNEEFLDTDDRQHLQLVVEKFINIVVTTSWNRYWKVLKREAGNLKKWWVNVDKLWAGMF
jgi:hypothetical protein